MKRKNMNQQNLTEEEIKEAAGAFLYASLGMILVYAIIWLAYQKGGRYGDSYNND